MGRVMKLAVMQPYFFPYLGYFQLLHAVDLFVIYDDVNFIKGGWINRNFILMNGRAQRITVPLAGASSFKTIAATRLVADRLWREKLLKTLRQAYSKAPHFNQVYALAEGVILSRCSSLAELALGSLRAVADYLLLTAEIRPSASYYANQSLKGQTRILDICRRESADAYYNLPGGEVLYDRSAFSAAGVNLRFVFPGEPHYRQFGYPFVPRLSILDVLMFNPPETVHRFLANCEIA